MAANKKAAKAGAGAFAAAEVDLDGIGVGHVDDLVDDGFDLFARVHGAASVESRDYGVKS